MMGNETTSRLFTSCNLGKKSRVAVAVVETAAVAAVVADGGRVNGPTQRSLSNNSCKNLVLALEKLFRELPDSNGMSRGVLRSNRLSLTLIHKVSKKQS